MLEPYDGKLSRTVLRGESGGNTADLLDTMKSKHKRFFISVINEVFGKNYSLNTEIEALPSEGYLTETETEDGSKEIEEQISDFLLKIGKEVYLIECQSYDDNSMAIRIAEYAFIVARQFAKWDIGRAEIFMPRFVVIYVKSSKDTPENTRITFRFPNGQAVDYESENVILDSFTKESIIEKRLFAYIPFYIARYEKEIVSEKDIDAAVKDLEYFRDEMYKLHEQGELGDIEIVDLMGFVNTIITHISDGNSVEERLVNIMGGTVIETESERLMREAREDVFEIMDAINNGADTLEALEELGYKKDVAKAVLKKMQKVV